MKEIRAAQVALGERLDRRGTTAVREAAPLPVDAAGTRRLLGDRFETVDLGSRRLKGFADHVRAWRVMGERQASDRFEARRAAGLSPGGLVGAGGAEKLLSQLDHRPRAA